ncbi:DUF3373 family protein [Sulfurovum riftiae]|uniref:DUF3373 domain-containing protein n=1 Tax=Sulfurovum riftiae TaxID=1630136 RepID=A0A151CHX7_9BACT|nr:DUF3373 family protein [Sulfurovum riftiae]KYJ87121.1 hypothetical protein AS592_08960 [Sulfurovum riftiae]
MKKIVSLSVMAAAATSFAFGSTADDIANLQAQIDKLKTKQGKINAQSANDNIKWGVDFRTAYDNINYDMANGTSVGNDSLLSMRLWLNMAYAPDEHNVFKGQLSMNKAFGADFGPNNGQMGSRAFSMGGMFDWTGNEALTDNNLKVRQAYWLYLGDKAFGADIPWTFSIGRRPSTNGFLANLREDDAAQSPLAHVINVEFDGLSSKLDLSNVTGVPGMSFKVCLGYGATNAAPLFTNATPYADNQNDLDDIKLGGFIFEPYNDGQFIVKTTWYKAFDLPGQQSPLNPNFDGNFHQFGDMQGAALSVLVDGLTEDGYFADAKVFGSFAWSKSMPYTGSMMMGSPDDETGTSWWVGTQLPVVEGGVFGLEYNHGSEFWRPFTYAEDTMIGSKIAARGDAWEAYFTYQINDALSLQARYTDISYDYTGSNGFFGNYSGASMKIDDIKDGAAMWSQLGGTQDPTSGQTVYMNLAQMMQMDPMDPATQEALMPQVQQMGMAAAFAPNIVEAAQDFRIYLRYRF